MERNTENTDETSDGNLWDTHLAQKLTRVELNPVLSANGKLSKNLSTLKRELDKTEKANTEP